MTHRAPFVQSALRAAIGLGALLLTAAGACAADYGSAAPTASDTAFRMFEEFRIGVHAHDINHNEKGSADISVDLYSSRLTGFNDGTMLGWFLSPRLNLGAQINTEGKTSFVYFGANWKAPVYGPVFVDMNFGGAVNDGEIVGVPGRSNMGCHLTFHEGINLGVDLTERVSILAGIEHISNANLCYSNDGITNVGVRMGYKF